MKKAVKIFTAITAAAVAVAGAVYVVRKFFLHDDELEEFDDEELFEDEACWQVFVTPVCSLSLPPLE